MRTMALTWVFVLMSICSAHADAVTINAANNGTLATVSFNDGAGHSGTTSAVLSQFNVTYTGSGGPSTFDTFTFDLFHTVTVGQTYAVTRRNDLATAFVNGSRIAYLFVTYGVADLTNNDLQAAALQLALWDLSLDNHTPTAFGPDGSGGFDSGDPSVFSVSLGANPQANQVAALTSQYLTEAVNATALGSWLDGGGGAANLLAVPEPATGVLLVLALGGLAVRGARRR
jgi:hypothetical protein